MLVMRYQLWTQQPASGSAIPAVADSAESASPVKETVLSEDENLIEEDNTASPPEMKDKSFRIILTVLALVNSIDP